MPKAMTKSQLTRLLAEEANVPRKAAATMLDALVETAIKQTKSKGIFTLPGIGKLRKANRKARMGRNPQTGESIRIPRKTVRFRVSKVCRGAIIGLPWGRDKALRSLAKAYGPR
ncbi:HU family DNA-binding protein [Acidobacteriia bacterium AH_259_A11_L15]|nr:HU family DNA-binding protein [Acidobacteriia bacterium AH_259_A11_L15]